MDQQMPKMVETQQEIEIFAGSFRMKRITETIWLWREGELDGEASFAVDQAV